MVRKSGPFGPLAHCSGQHAFVSLAIGLSLHSLKPSWSHNLVNSIGCYPSAKEFGSSCTDFGCKTTATALRPTNRIHLILILGQAHQDAVLSDMSKGVQFNGF